MKFYEALDRTLDAYEISAKWLSEQSGVSMQMISQFRRGKQRVYSDSLEAMIGALPLEVRRHYYSLMNGDSISVSAMSEMELADIMDKIAEVLRQRTNERNNVRSSLVRI
ncbi:hypothetical protein [Microcoleus sp. OTE_8_concoct_300]|uniref:hypothetical protein n=1 Tax=Microcoleus sp. OTE_8_concoct_300 TaxID=2964710 RepID=UPI00403F0E3B